MLFALMIAGLLLSTSIPKAFEGRGLAFALAYAAMQVGRSAFFCVVGAEIRNRSSPKFHSHPDLAQHQRDILDCRRHRGRRDPDRPVAGGIADRICRAGHAFSDSGPRRLIDPDWIVEGGHMAERCAGFIIIALGESVVVTGATFADAAWTATSIAAIAGGSGRQHRDVVGLLPHRRRGRFAAHLKGRGYRPDRAAGLYLSASADRRRHRRVGGRR